MKLISLMIGALMFSGCVAAPRDVTVVDGFELDRYLGTWFEIARLDHRFERGLTNVSANYSKRDDGGINVVNRGFNPQKEIWKEAKGRAYPVGKPGEASLKVTFFWPFYAGYNIIALDRDKYQYALVCGPSKRYLWILARSTRLEQPVRDQLVAKAKAYGFNTDELIYVEHRE